LSKSVPASGDRATAAARADVPTPRVGTPQVYISHGRTDTVLPIDRTTRRIVPQLRAAGIPTEVHEFDGPHLVPPNIVEDSVRWLTRP